MFYQSSKYCNINYPPYLRLLVNHLGIAHNSLLTTSHYRIVVLLRRMQLPPALVWSVQATTLTVPSATAHNVITSVTTIVVGLITLCTPLLVRLGLWIHRCKISPLRPLSGELSIFIFPLFFLYTWAFFHPLIAH